MEQIAVTCYVPIHLVYHLHPFVVVHAQRRDRCQLFQLVQQIAALGEQQRISRGDGGQLLGREIAVREHLPEVVHVDVGHLADHQHALLNLTGVAYQIVHRAQGVEILFPLFIDFDRFLEVIQHVRSGGRRFEHFVGAVHDTLRQIGGIECQPLCVGRRR